jgi:hypothetical protein
MPKILMLAIALVLTLGVVAEAGCPGGVCRKPVRNAIQSIPTLAPRANTHTARPVRAKAVERSVVVRRSHVRGPGFWARITFRPGRR